MQVDRLRQTCLEQMLFHLSSANILSFASVADRLSEKSLLDACLEYWATSPDRCCSELPQSNLLPIICSYHILRVCTYHSTCILTSKSHFCAAHVPVGVPPCIHQINFVVIPHAMLLRYSTCACCSADIVKSAEMASLMRKNTSLAQGLLARVVAHTTKKARIT